jgi:predicted SAM-dependent methyltransferase
MEIEMIYEKQLMPPPGIILDLGCGKKKRSGTIGVDYSDRHDADLVHDLNVFPYPFEDDSVDYVYMDNVLDKSYRTLFSLGLGVY